MRRTFSARHNAILSHATLSWGAFAIAFALVALFFRAAAPGAFWFVAAPALKAGDRLAAVSRGLFGGFGDAAALTERVSELASENAALATENRALTEQAAEFAALLGEVPAPRASVIAGVIARPPESPYDTLVLSGGADAGVILGMEAFGKGGIPLGLVTSVAPNATLVTLFSAPGMTVSGWIGAAKVPVTLSGRGGGVMSAMVSRSAEVREGDAVFVPGPGALPVGSIVRVDSDPAAPSLTLRIQPAVNLYSVTWAELRDTGLAESRAVLFSTTTPL